MPNPTIRSSKVCTKCGEDKSLADYYEKREANKNLRLFSHCKDCHQRITGQWQARNREKVRQLHRGYDAQRLRSQRRDVNKEAARAAVARALLNGRLIKPLICEVCCNPEERGSDGRSLLQAHHPSYDMPLIVEWLCASCHQRRHSHRYEEAS